MKGQQSLQSRSNLPPPISALLNPVETEPPILPPGPVTLHHLTGEYYGEKLSSPNTIGLPRFRDVPILSTHVLPDDLAHSLRRTLSSHHTYQGEPARCFIPRHGLQFGGEGGVEALICLECHLAYFWLNGDSVGYALSETAGRLLSTHFRSAEPVSRGLDPVQTLHEASFAQPPDRYSNAQRSDHP
jgi:hypothetical protein